MKWHRDNRHVPSIFVSFCQLCLVVVACQSHDNLLQTEFKMLHTATSIGRHIVRVSSFDQIAELITLRMKLLNRLCGFFSLSIECGHKRSNKSMSNHSHATQKYVFNCWLQLTQWFIWNYIRFSLSLSLSCLNRTAKKCHFICVRSVLSMCLRLLMTKQCENGNNERDIPKPIVEIECWSNADCCAPHKMEIQ